MQGTSCLPCQQASDIHQPQGISQNATRLPAQCPHGQQTCTKAHSYMYRSQTLECERLLFADNDVVLLDNAQGTKPQHHP